MKRNCPGQLGGGIYSTNPYISVGGVIKGLAWPFRPLWKPRWNEGKIIGNNLLYLKVNHPEQSGGNPNEIIPTNLSALLLVLIIGYICYKIKSKRGI